VAWQIRVHLVAAPARGDSADPTTTIPIASTGDSAAVRTAASAVLREARAEAQALARQDPVLGQIARAEAQRLAHVLRGLGHDTEAAPLGLVRGSS
jgi:hypothetical protein